MKNLLLFLIVAGGAGYSCTKEDLSPNRTFVDVLSPKEIYKPGTTAVSIYNPIVGKWELGMFKILCAGATDTTVYKNEVGDYVEFLKTDTAFYTYNTTNATGWSPYEILDSTSFVLGDTMRIISYDGNRLTTYTKSSNGGAEQWMTYKKVSE